MRLVCRKSSVISEWYVVHMRYGTAMLAVVAAVVVAVVIVAVVVVVAVAAAVMIETPGTKS